MKPTNFVHLNVVWEKNIREYYNKDKILSSSQLSITYGNKYLNSKYFPKTVPQSFFIKNIWKTHLQNQIQIGKFH